MGPKNFRNWPEEDARYVPVYYSIPNWQGFHKIQIKKMLVVANRGLVLIDFFVQYSQTILW